MPFSQKTVHGGMAGIVMEKNKDTVDMQCFPLYSLLMAVGNRTVNYLSLDIEGAEFLVWISTVRKLVVKPLSGAANYPLGQGGHRGDDNRDKPCWRGFPWQQAGDQRILEG